MSIKEKKKESRKQPVKKKKLTGKNKTKQKEVKLVAFTKLPRRSVLLKGKKKSQQRNRKKKERLGKC